MTQPNFASDALRGFYEHTVQVAATEMPHATMPAFDALDAGQRRAWTLAFSATAELAVRMVDALTSVGIAADTEG